MCYWVLWLAPTQPSRHIACPPFCVAVQSTHIYDNSCDHSTYATNTSPQPIPPHQVCMVSSCHVVMLKANASYTAFPSEWTGIRSIQQPLSCRSQDIYVDWEQRFCQAECIIVRLLEKADLTGRDAGFQNRIWFRGICGGRLDLKQCRMILFQET